jgi:hypothetical protein
MDHYLNTPAGETMARFLCGYRCREQPLYRGLVGAAADLLKIGGLLLALFAISPVVGWIAAGRFPLVSFCLIFSAAGFTGARRGASNGCRTSHTGSRKSIPA